MGKVRVFYILMTVALCTQATYSQSGDTLRNKRLKPMLISAGVAYGVTLVGLNQLWYSDFEREPFHFFNDNNEWNQMDKVGHLYSAFHISQLGYRGLKWSGLSQTQSAFWGSLTGVIVMTPIEIFDGFSSAYGASVGDLLANTAGSALFYGQQLGWEEIRIHPKFSFNRSDFPKLRPDVLGHNLSEEFLKDYNAQTYWLSFDISRFKQVFPKWLNFAVGYSTTGMIYATKHQNVQRGYNPQRRFFLSVDFDLNEYHTDSKLINTLIYLVNMIHIPAPALELSEQKLKFHFIR